ncbi:MAG: ROK family protein [bacterium]|nr:ROK family protein [bacterium]
MNKEKVYIGIDIGATKIQYGIIDIEGKIIKQDMILTPVDKQWSFTLDKLVEKYNKILEKLGLDDGNIYGIGIGCPGTFDSDRRNISYAPNLKWNDVPIKDYLEERIRLPIWLENDTNVAALGVSEYGEGKGTESLIGLFLGTGIGGGIILNGKIYSGKTGGAGELGHIVVNSKGPRCGCGNKGCLEAYASTTSIYNRIKNNYERNFKGQKLFKYFRDNENKTDAIVKAYESEEKHAMKILNEAFFYFGIGVANIITIFNPEMVVFGGGLAGKLQNIILENVNRAVKQWAMPGTFESVKIIRTKLGGKAPLLGGAALVRNNLEYS